MKLILTSDWHLGYFFASFTEEENKILEQARFKTVSKIFDYANINNISLILVAGDQFENGIEAEPYLIKKLFNIIRDYPQIKVVMIAGNHDYLSPDSIYYKISKDEYPPNLLFVEEREKEIEIDELNVKIYASSLKEKNGNYNPIDWIKNEESSFFRIALAHGSLAIEGNYNPDDFPIQPNFANERNLDLIALGHWHSLFKYDDRTLFSGTHEPIQFKNQGKPLEIEIEKGGSPKIKELELTQFKWEEKELALTDENYKNLLAPEEDSRNKIKKLVLKGFISIDKFKDFLETLNAIQGSYFKLFVENEVKIKPEEEKIKELLKDSYVLPVIDKLLQIEKNKTKLDFSEIQEDISQEDIVDAALLYIYEYYSKK